MATTSDGSATAQAQDKAQQAAGQAREQAQQAAGQAREQVRTQVDQRSTQAGQQVAQQAGDLRTVGEELRKQGKDGPAKVADQAAERAERVGRYLEQSDADRLLSDVEDFARKRPWAVMAGGIALGVAASRFLKASQRDRYEARRAGTYGTTSTPSTAASPALEGRFDRQPVTPGAPATGQTQPAVPATPIPTPATGEDAAGRAGTSPAPTGNELSSGVGATRRPGEQPPSAHPTTPARPGTGGL
jgi:hypothetical protein